MKTVQIDLTQRPNMHPVSDGIGGEHKHGAIVELPDDVADALIVLKCAFPVDGSSLIGAKEAAKIKAAADIQAQIHAQAKRAMRLHDNLPAEVRAAVHEHGDEATESYLAHLQEQIEQPSINPTAPFKRPRGRPRKQPRLDA